MACECIKKTLEMVRDKYDDPDGEFNTTAMLNFKTGKASTTWPCIVFSYRRKKKDGNYMKNKERINIIPTFCPSCGIKY